MCVFTFKNPAKHSVYVIALTLCCFVSFPACTPSGQSPPRAIGALSDIDMVSTTHPISTDVGVKILEKGGNAYDAAIAIQFALAVVYPRAGNIGGGGFMLSRSADGSYHSLDFREKAPLAAHRDMYLDAEGEVIERLSLAGTLAAGVPGVVEGMVQIYQQFGSLPWSELLQPAIDLAIHGHLLTDGEATALNRYMDEFREYNPAPNVFTSRENWIVGDSLIQPELGATLQRIQEEGREGFYGGKTADYLIAWMKSTGAVMDHQDLKEYRAQWRTPLAGMYKNHLITSMPPPSSGGVALLQLLRGSENFDWKRHGHNSPQAIHHMTELMRRVYADRAAYLGDPDFYQVPVGMLLGENYLSKRFSDIDDGLKTPSQLIREGEVERIESFETTHFSIVDTKGNAVAITTTLNGNFGCKVVVPGAGFFLNNEMDDFSIKPGVPNQFGLPGGEANAIVPGKRMLSSMTPTIVEKEGRLFLVVGTPGGSTIITAVYQTLLNVLEYDMTMQEAVNAKKIHAQWLPDYLYLESGLATEALKGQLENYGHEIKISPSLGRMNCIKISTGGLLEGAADTSRNEGTARGR
ncbi:MAG: gamma-glutamyltransferase [Cyclobacteriaceae bacterium]|nr:gamma-glutamyltransferase [Cyclobacteriaceae bacterium]